MKRTWFYMNNITSIMVLSITSWNLKLMECTSQIQATQVDIVISIAYRGKAYGEIYALYLHNVLCQGRIDFV